jgi:hypothetical protein
MAPVPRTQEGPPSGIGSGRCFRSVDFVSDGHSKRIPIDKQPNDQIVHTFRFGEKGSRQNDVKMHAKAESLKSQHDTTSQRLVFHTELASMTRMVGH